MAFPPPFRVYWLPRKVQLAAFALLYLFAILTLFSNVSTGIAFLLGITVIVIHYMKYGPPAEEKKQKKKKES